MSSWDVENYSHTFLQAFSCICPFACLNAHVPKLKCKQENGWNQDQLISLNSPSGIEPVLTPLTVGSCSLISISLWEADTFLSVVCWMQTAWRISGGFCSFYLYLSHNSLVDLLRWKNRRRHDSWLVITKLNCSVQSALLVSWHKE